MLERLSARDASQLGFDPHAAIYSILGELPTASDKARRDAGGLAVCDITEISPTT